MSIPAHHIDLVDDYLTLFESRYIGDTKQPDNRL